MHIEVGDLASNRKSPKSKSPSPNDKKYSRIGYSHASKISDPILKVFSDKMNLNKSLARPAVSKSKDGESDLRIQAVNVPKVNKSE